MQTYGKEKKLGWELPAPLQTVASPFKLPISSTQHPHAMRFTQEFWHRRIFHIRHTWSFTKCGNIIFEIELSLL